MKEKVMEKGFDYAVERFSQVGVDIEAAIELIDSIPISVHSWQGDDLIGFDGIGELTGGIAATGNYPGRASSAEELRQDLEKAFSFIPGKLKLNLHSCHAETVDGHRVDRDNISIKQFQKWVDWAKQCKIGMDFNPTFFSHPKMDGDFSLSSEKEEIRKYLARDLRKR